MFLAIVAYTGPDALKVQIDEVGRYPTESEAKAAIENFIEGTIEIERPEYQGLQSRVIEI
jgi:hypothetical protein